MDQQLPSGFIEQVVINSEELYSGQTIVIEPEIPEEAPSVVPDLIETNTVSDKEKKEDNQPSLMHTAITQAETTSFPAAKYATYSRSEVDLLLKQQSESISSAFNAKIAGQQKMIAELLKSKEREFKQDQEGLKIYLDESEEKLKKNQQANQKEIESFLDQGKKELAVESEQFKAYLNKSIMPTLKSLDGKVISIVTNYLDEQSKTKDTAKSLISERSLLVLPYCLVLLIWFWYFSGTNLTIK